jgi:hypothetical protein
LCFIKIWSALPALAFCPPESETLNSIRSILILVLLVYSVWNTCLGDSGHHQQAILKLNLLEAEVVPRGQVLTTMVAQWEVLGIRWEKQREKREWEGIMTKYKTSPGCPFWQNEPWSLGTRTLQDVYFIPENLAHKRTVSEAMLAC